jgi:hypothetical protein
MVWIIDLKYLLGLKRLQLIGRYGYVEMTRYLMIQILLLSRLSIGARLYSVHGHVYNVCGIMTCLRRCLHDWKTRREVFLPDIDDIVIFGFVLCSLRRLYSSMDNCIEPFFYFLVWLNWIGCVHLSTIKPFK